LAFKQGQPFTAGIVFASSILSGAFYPVSVLPGWVQTFSIAIPQTSALEAMRLAALQGASPGQLMPEIGALLGFAVFLIPLSLWSFRRSLRRAKIVGSLAHY
jgi:ABC-2 type transport system permease protein